MKIRSFFFAFLALIPVGCYATYTGIYFLDRSERPPSVTFQGIASQVSYVIAPFGFRRIHLPKELEKLGPVFSHNKGDGDKHLMRLSGSDARVSIAVSFRGTSITIRDMSYDKETEFIRAIRNALEKHLKGYYRLKKLKFDRQIDIL